VTLALVTVTTAFVVRTLIIFGVLALCAWVLDQYAFEQNSRPQRVYRAVVAVLLVLWLLTTFEII
jgi:hypothetical protein